MPEDGKYDQNVARVDGTNKMFVVVNSNMYVNF